MCILRITNWNVSDGANTTITCKSFGCIGQPFEITCDIDGTPTSGISWSDPHNRNVVTCNPAGKCFPLPGYDLVNKTASKQVLRIAKVSPSDVGTWLCADGSEHVQPMCNLSALGRLRCRLLLVFVSSWSSCIKAFQGFT